LVKIQSIKGLHRQEVKALELLVITS